jgi:hypothetical protein
MAATDVDLARITGIAVQFAHGEPLIETIADQDEERRALTALAEGVLANRSVSIITFGGFNFDLPLIMRRARYLGVDFPSLNLDRFKSPHIDLCELLSDRNPQRRRSLQFYVKRIGWTDLVKPLSGADEARVPETGRWAELVDSLRHDVTATYRVAQWCGAIKAAV